MRALFILIALQILPIGCCWDYSEGGINATLSLQNEKEELYVSIYNKNAYSVYLTSKNDLKIYKLDSNGLYKDWTSTFLNNSLVLLENFDDELIGKELNWVPIAVYEKLRSKYLEKAKYLDSVSILHIGDLIDFKLYDLLYLSEGEEYIKKLNLYPLKQIGGSFKITYFHKPKKGFNAETHFFEFPSEINSFKRLDNKFKSNIIYVCY